MRLQGDDGALVLTVTDDGCGFDPAGPEVRGQRLGLTSMDERATELGGTLRVTSTLGEGTTVRLEVPRVIRVLLADDHAVVRQGLRTFLDLQDDIEVVAEAGDGEAAIDAAARTDPDVILLDLVMPRLDGVGALKRLRETRARIIVLTSFGDDDKLFAALRAGAAGYLLKDVEPAELVRAIRAAHEGNAPLSPTIATRVVEEIAHGGGAPAAGRRPHPARARRPDPDRPRPLEQGHRPRARRGREDGQDPRLPHPLQARPHRPHPSRPLRRPPRPGRT